jgi:uncharacterized membrane protein YphA (DoxX/SURF4 family)
MAAAMIDVPEPKLVEWPLRGALSVVFIYAGVMKALDPQQFAVDVQHYELTPWDVSVVIAMYLPWLEIFAGAALLARRLYRGALALMALMTVAFLGAIGSAWWRGLDITCGCFGGEENRTNFAQHIALNGAMLVAVAVLAWLEKRAPAALPAADEPA